MLTKTSIAEIRNNWNQKAEDESPKYFYDNGWTDDIIMGHKCLVIGRKGTGKTAICEYLINSLPDKGYSVKSINFEDFPLDLIQKLYQHGIQADSMRLCKLFWKTVILSQICSMFEIKNESVKRILGIIYPNYGDAKVRSHPIVSINSINLDILYLKLELVIENKRREWTIDEVAEYLEKFLLNYFIDRAQKPCEKTFSIAKVFVLFDRLDAEYNFNINSQNEERIYYSLLVALFHAVYDIRRKFRNTRVEKKDNIVNCVVFLRDDIFDRLSDVHKATWSSESIILHWREPEIKKLLAHRLGIVFSASDASFDDVWNEICEPKHAQQAFRTMIHRTQLRPRDFIMYIQVAVDAIYSEYRDSPNEINTRLTISSIDKAATKYSMQLRQHIIDEALPQFSNIDSVLTALDRLGTDVFSKDEANSALSICCEERKMTIDDLLRQLYNINVIGMKATAKEQFRYKYNGMRFDIRDGAVYRIHEGLVKSIIVSGK